MTEERFTADEFARLLALEARDPERLRLEADPRFAAWQRMHLEFETPLHSSVAPGELEQARVELAHRMRAVLEPTEREPASAEGPPPERRSEPSSPRPKRGSWFERWMGGSMLRPAVALAATVVAVSAVWWMSNRGPAPGIERGARDASALVLHVESGIDRAELSWNAIAGAESYRVVFYGADLAELARREADAALGLRLAADSLPAGLVHGAEVAVEVVAIQGETVLATSRVVTLRVP
ncbi:MAG: hypothetical protein HOP12_14165 [Candidatus Eisenbacteria bacterium]|uniref:Uncharacterized protein n=1 Tax=Eiseniibacteriota bacterium TaxID=2212470 RepID=A0A849ST92_UNCEI|nr:hypothetical protein [Candidatus Eisenbacteria bacterium]